MIRVFIFVFFIERMLAVQSFDRFNIRSFNERINFANITADSLNFATLNFDIMAGFDAKLLADVGKIDFNLITFDSSGQVTDGYALATVVCPKNHFGVKYAERETGKSYGSDFEMLCLAKPEKIALTGSKHSGIEN